MYPACIRSRTICYFLLIGVEVEVDTTHSSAAISRCAHTTPEEPAGVQHHSRIGPKLSTQDMIVKSNNEDSTKQSIVKGDADRLGGCE